MVEKGSKKGEEVIKVFYLCHPWLAAGQGSRWESRCFYSIYYVGYGSVDQARVLCLVPYKHLVRMCLPPKCTINTEEAHKRWEGRRRQREGLAQGHAVGQWQLWEQSQDVPSPSQMLSSLGNHIHVSDSRRLRSFWGWLRIAYRPFLPSRSKGSLGNKALSHDSVFIFETAPENAAGDASSQENIPGRVKTLQVSACLVFVGLGAALHASCQAEKALLGSCTQPLPPGVQQSLKLVLECPQYAWPCRGNTASLFLPQIVYHLDFPPIEAHPLLRGFPFCTSLLHLLD